MSARESARWRSVAAGAAAALLVGAHVALGLATLSRTSVTIDEFAHVPAGYATWKTGDPRLDDFNPPLFKSLAFGPVLDQLEPPPRLRFEGPWERGGVWGFGYQFMAANYDRYPELFVPARIAVLLVSAALALCLFLVVRNGWGSAAALATLALYAFDPTIVAHASLATLDVGTMAAMVAVLLIYRRFRQQPAWWRASLAGFALGLAIAVKFSAMLLAPLLALMSLVRVGSADPPLGNRVRTLVLIGIVAVVGIGAGYGFHRMGPTAAELALASPVFRVLDLPGLRDLPLPFPHHFLAGIDGQIRDAADYTYYLRGELSDSGWPHYYLVGLAVKLTPPALAFVLFGLGWALARRDRELLWFWVLPAAWIVAFMSVVAEKQLGVRYVLPALPLLYAVAGVAASQALAALPAGTSRVLAGGTCVALLAWHAGEALRTTPHHLAYFSPVVGGSAGGLGWLGDSNLDWGQDLPALRTFMQERGIDEVALAYYGRVDPALYGIRYRALTRPPKAEWVVVSASFLQGLPYHVLAPGSLVATGNHGRRMRPGSLAWSPREHFSWLREYQPVARLGGSLYVYRLPLEAGPRSPDSSTRPDS